MKKKIKRKKFNNIKKTIKNFIQDEEGFLSKENILKIGLATISALGVLGSLSNSYAGHTSHGVHNNLNYLVEQPVGGTTCFRIVGTHTNTASHTNHGSY